MASPKRNPKRNQRNPRPAVWGYRLLGVALLPLCAVVGRTLWRLIAGPRHPFQGMPGSTPVWYFAGGLVLWLLVCGFIPQPVRLYVLGHELTHAIGAWLSGGSARRLRISRGGGSVTVTRSNVLVVLGPYFVPFYAVIVLVLYFISTLIFEPHPWHRWWMAALGVAWGFHLTFTVDLLARPQRDLMVYGRFFSGVLILLCNMLALAAGLTWIGDTTFGELAGGLWAETVTVHQGLYRWLAETIIRGVDSFIQ